MSQQQASQKPQKPASDDSACVIKVESCPKVMKFFAAFKECHAMAQEIEVRKFGIPLTIDTSSNFFENYVSLFINIFSSKEMNKTKIEELMKRLCILRKQNERLREKNCTLREQYKRLLCE